MFKKIHTLMLGCALALPMAPAALAEYEKICLNNRGGYTAGFQIEIKRRGEAKYEDAKSFYLGAGGGGVNSTETKCVSPADAGVRPGDSIRFMVNPFGDISSKGNKHCGPNRDRARGFEDVFLMPDGPREGNLTFKSWGGVYHVSCEVEHSNSERMHSKCGATRDGMSKIGCNRFELDQELELGTSGNTQIPQAVENDATIGQFYDLLDRGAYDANQAMSDGSTGLHVAARHGRADHIDILVERGADLDLRTDDGSTPLMVAIADNRFDIAKQLLAAGANPNLAREDGEFPLHYAAQQGDSDIVQSLLDHGALTNALHAETGKSPLDVASAREDRDRDPIVRLLIRGGAVHRVHLEEIPNIVATDGGIDKLEQALNEGGDVNQATGDGITGLHVAAELNRGDYAETLLDRGAMPDLQDNQGRTPLMVAIESEHDYPAVVQALLFEGANPNLERLDGNFPLYLAVEKGLDSVVDMLLFFGKNIEVSKTNTRTNKTPLKLADELFTSGKKSEHGFIKESLLNEGASR